MTRLLTAQQVCDQFGVPLWDIAGWLGQDIETTTRIYAHHHPDFMQNALDAADRRR
jgi:predicted acyl esterase